jgi:hypothetical protein
MTDPRGRQPIGLNQPPGGGTNYPFVNPSSAIQYLFADLFVSFDDINEEVVYPLRVAWAYGFGTNVVGPISGFPTPENARDILILDANDRVIFDSTQADEFTQTEWNNRLSINEWASADAVCRTVIHTAWTDSDVNDGQDQPYDDYIEPTNGELHGDAWYELPKRVTSLTVGLARLAQTRVVLSEGYNVALEHQPAPVVATLDLSGFNTGKKLAAGERTKNQISISAEPGSGLGVFPGCIDLDQRIRTINRTRSNSYQNFTYHGDGCIRTQRPVGLTQNDPREFKYVSFSLTQAESAAAIETLNDCSNCCDCEYFARTYRGIKRQWFLYQDVANLAAATRDQYADNRDRWIVQKAIREADTLKLRAQADGNCKISWGMAHCNASKCCISSVTVELTWLYYLNGILQTPASAGYDCNKSKLDGSAQCNGAESIVLDMDETGRHAYVFWDYSDPQSVATLQGRHCFPDCAMVEDQALKVQMHAVIYWESSGDDPGTGEPCEYPLLEEADYPANVLATWAELGIPVPAAGRAQKITPLLAVSDNDPFCERCACTEGNSQE